ncbi:DUF2235 domain-containing protein [Pseudomonas sp. UYIF39]|uniref:phospholipase effector Tle1 domain-containing protein n=1 Tax=Pseudomonas sp. UYIF39 TaxID=1630747 RepID=UPI00249E12C8|nr:DUF2235 domain-containing protein [Pseudomonas sp. UYIF39]MDI3353165.1 DUF2235 domain-containing protein [Pseudomonas sp. UYIF39]
MSSPANLDNAQAISARSSAAAGTKNTAALPCNASLHIGFFFDGFSRNLEDDLREDRLSNVGRLFLAHPYDQTTPPPDPVRQFQKFYISGLGAPFDDTLGTGAETPASGLKGAINKTKDDISELPKDTATDTALEAGKDILTGKNWWERLVHNLKLKNAVASALNAAAKASIEAVPIVRDNELVADLLKTGVDTRLEAAWDRFEKLVDEISKTSSVPIKRISVSVFGYDYGATLARAFAHKLFEECDPGTNTYKDATLEVVFAGLFDAVDRSMEASVVRDFLLPFTNDVDDGECLPGPVKAALHLVAAHECRSVRRSRLIGTGSLTPRWEERLVPGTSYDVGGGLKKEDSLHSRELHLASLHEMYRAAFRAGVPFPEMEKLPDIGVKISKLFELNDHINGTSALDASKRYMSKAGNQKVSAESFLAHRRLYIQRLRGLWEIYSEQHRAYSDEEERLERPILGDQGSLKRMLGMGSETEAQAAKRDNALKQTRERKAGLRADLGWLEQVDREAWRLRTGFASPPEKALLDEWFAPKPKNLSFDIEDLLELYLNDQFMMSQMPQTQTTIKYFLVREFDSPDLTKTKGMAPDYLEQIKG